jgi:hypothetical protein
MNEISRLIGLFEMAKTSRKIAKRIYDRIKSGHCIHCEKKPVSRGLCETCKARFYQQRWRMETKLVPEWEAKCIRAGLILAVGESAKIKSDNPFARVG